MICRNRRHCRDFTTERSLPRDEGRDWERQWVGFSLKRWLGLNSMNEIEGGLRRFWVSMLMKRCVISLALAGLAGSLFGAELTSKEVEFFENKIRPILAESCYECHNSVDKKKGDLALDYRDALLESDVIVPGKPEESPLILAIRHGGDYEAMPPKSPKLANIIIKNFEDWIRMGAPDPRTTKPTKEDLANQVDWESVRDRRKEWWAFQPLRKSQAPSAKQPEWNGNVIDQFISAGLAKGKLQPAGKATPAALVRRVHLILTGLPPKPEVVEAFVADPSETAYEKMVDDLMTTKQYGERWARYWMDWYRYAESHGSEGDPAIPYANQYRDYLVRALNADVPYDQMIREHLAGDLLEKPRINAELGLNESAIGPAHFRMVPHGFGVTDAYDEQITFTDNQVDVVSKAMLGMTVSCARCHNHKFDPISQKDFYKFYGIMIGSRPAIVNVDSPELKELHRKQLSKMKPALRRAFADYWLGVVDGAIGKLEVSKLEKIKETDPLAAWAKLNGVKDIARRIADLEKKHQESLVHNEKTKSSATFYADLRDPKTYARWFENGNGLGEGPSGAGAFAIAGGGEKALTGIYPSGVYSHLISDKHSATLSSVFHKAKGDKAMMRVVGSKAQARFVMRSYPLSHGLVHPAAQLNSTLGWVENRKYTYWNGEKGYFQVNTGPDSTTRGGGDRSWFGVLEAYAGQGAMRDVGVPIVVFPKATEVINDRASLLEFYRTILRSALRAWKSGSMNDDQAQLLNAFVSRGFLPNAVKTLPKGLRAQIETYRKLESEIRVPVRAPGVMEGEVWDQPLLSRGDYKKEEEPVERTFLEIFDGKPYSKTESGRRELAEDILRENNPLTSRVIVNRLWNHVFGRGLVASADNFGRLGKEPSHPELLDTLAIDFRASGWKMKPFVKQLVMSRTFRSASLPPRANGDRDAENEMLAYFPPRRLDAEAILDTINHIATGGGGQRAMYRAVRRNRLDPFLKAFNLPIPTSTVGDRNLTNVPAQALTLMNGREVAQAARQWSQRIKNDQSLKTSEAKVRRFFLQAYARPPSAEELAASVAYLDGKVDDDTGRLREKHAVVSESLSEVEKEREAILGPIRSKLQAEVDRRNSVAAKNKKPVDLKPIGRWDFEGNSDDSVSGLKGILKGNAKVIDGALHLNGGCLMSEPLKTNLGAKTLEVLVQLDKLNQQGGGAMTVQTVDGVTFDSIVFGEKDPGQWLSGSNSFTRTEGFGGPQEKEANAKAVRIAIVYHQDGRIEAYRDGRLYGKSYRKGNTHKYQAGRSQVVLGLRHGVNPGGGRMLTGKVFEARLYDRALTREEVAAAASGSMVEIVTAKMIDDSLNDSQGAAATKLKYKIARISKELAGIDRELAERKAAMSGTGDPFYRFAHALLNSKELIYVH